MSPPRTCFLLFLTFGLFTCSTAPKVPEEVSEKRNKAVEYAEYGNRYYRQGLYSKALEMFSLSLAYCGSVDYEPGIVRSYNSLGKVYMALGKVQEAELNFNRAFGISQRLEDPVLSSQTLTNRGEVFLRRGEYDAALKVFTEALENENRLEDPDRAIIYHNLGSLYRRMNRRDTALGYLQKAVELNERSKRSEELASNYYMLASLFSEQKNYEEAEGNALLALKYDKKVENSLGIAKDYLALGIISRKSGSLESAFRYLEQSLFVYRSLVILNPILNLGEDVRQVIRYLVEVAELTGKTEEAAYYRGLLTGEKE